MIEAEVGQQDTREVLPLSYGQQAMMLTRSMSASGSTDIHAAFPLDPRPTDESTVHRLLARFQARNDAFRAGLVGRGGRPAMQFLDAGEVAPIELVTDHRSGLGSWSFQPFGRRTTPLARAQLTERDQTLLLRRAIDGLVCDSWSIGMLTREVGELWRCRHGSPPDDGPRGSFRSYLHQQAGQGTPEAVGAYHRFWESQLDHDATVDLPRGESSGPNTSCSRVPAGTSSRLPALRQLRTTDFCIVAAAFATALSRISAQKSLVVHTEVADRTTPEALETIGALVNDVGLRVQVGRTLAESVRSCQIAMMRCNTGRARSSRSPVKPERWWRFL